jgi:hypothetical protein
MGLGRRTGWVSLQEGYLLRYNRVAFTVHVIPGLRSYSFLLCLSIALLYPLLFLFGPATLRFLYIILVFTLVFGSYMAGYSFGASFFFFFFLWGGTVERVSFRGLGMAILSLFPLFVVLDIPIRVTRDFKSIECPVQFFRFLTLGF